MAHLSITTSTRNGWHVITVTGEVTSATRSALREAFSGAAAYLPFVVADITAVDFRAPADFEPLIFGRLALRRAGGELRMVHASAIVACALDALVPEQDFPVYPDIDAATAGPARTTPGMR